MDIIIATDEKIVVPLFVKYRAFYGFEVNGHEAEFLRERIKHRESIIFIAMQDHIAAGFVQLYPTFSSLACGRVYIINDLYVDQAYRKGGLAEALMKRAISYAEQMGAAYITLETTVDNFGANRLYEKLGMTKDRTVHYSKRLK